jgi:hypothetical protein
MSSLFLSERPHIPPGLIYMELCASTLRHLLYTVCAPCIPFVSPLESRCGHDHACAASKDSLLPGCLEPSQHPGCLCSNVAALDIPSTEVFGLVSWLRHVNPSSKTSKSNSRSTARVPSQPHLPAESSDTTATPSLAPTTAKSCTFGNLSYDACARITSLSIAAR